jgi:YHS domain-containing protein
MKITFTALCLTAFIFAATPSIQAKTTGDTKAQAKAVAPKVFTSPQVEGTHATCPVTGEEFAIAKDTAHAEYKGKHVYFCCPGCQKSFDKDPEKYTK